MSDAFIERDSFLACLLLKWLGITWVLVYRTDKYKRLKAEVEKQSKKRKYEMSWLSNYSSKCSDLMSWASPGHLSMFLFSV